MTNIFEACLSHIVKVEGEFVNHPADRGGPTKYGITKRTLEHYRGVEVTDKDVFDLELSEASKIYELQYWNPMQLHRVRSTKVALILFDQAVNQGPVGAIQMLQGVLNDSFGEKLKVDGVLGNATDVCIATANEARLCRKLIQAAQLRYAHLCVKNSSQLVFLAGWLNRTFKLQELTL